MNVRSYVKVSGENFVGIAKRKTDCSSQSVFSLSIVQLEAYCAIFGGDQKGRTIP